MSKKKSGFKKARVKLGSSGAYLAGMSFTALTLYTPEPEPWQGNGKRPKKRIK